MSKRVSEQSLSQICPPSQHEKRLKCNRCPHGRRYRLLPLFIKIQPWSWLQIACLMPQNRRNSKDSLLADDQLALYIAQYLVLLIKYTGGVSCTNLITQESWNLFPLSFFSPLPLFQCYRTKAICLQVRSYCRNAVIQLHSLNRLTADTMAPNISQGPMASFLPLQPSQLCVAHSCGEASSITSKSWPTLIIQSKYFFM